MNRFKTAIKNCLTVGLGIFCVWVISVSPVFSQSKPANGYVKKQILFLKWGTGDYEIGLKAINHGPTAMAVDKEENIYITDPWNKRIQVFSIDGKFLKSISSDGIGPPLAVNDNGDIFTTYGSNGKWTGKLQCVKKNGERIKCDGSFREIYNKNGVKGSGGEKLFSFYDGKKNSSPEWSSSKFNEPLIQKEDSTTLRDFSDKKNKKLIVAIKTEKINRLLQKKGKSTVSDAVRIKLQYEQNGSWLNWKPLGFDNDGNVYILMSYATPSYGRLTDEKIQVYSIAGNLEAEIPLVVDYSFGTIAANHDFFKVDNQGNIFQLLNAELGVYIYKWVKK